MKMKNVEDVYPLSPMQELMLFHSLTASDAEVLSEQLSFTLHKHLRVADLRRAWQHVVERHPILRTAFLWDGLKRPLQVVRRQVKLPFVQQDWRGLSPTEQAERLCTFREADRAKGFDLKKAPIIRLTLIQMTDDTYHLLFSFHHILLDGWCLSLIFKELFAFYEAFGRGEALALPPTRPYKDYIAWLQKQDLAAAKQFWQQTLKEAKVRVPLRGDGVSDGYGSRQMTVSESVTAVIKQLAQENKLTLNTFLQGAWALLLGQYSRETDVVLGITVSGRPAELGGVEQMVGLFINILPLRIQIHAGATCLAWLKQVQEANLALRQFMHTPLTQIQAWGNLKSGTRLFDSLLVFENYPTSVSFGENEQSEQSLQVVDVVGGDVRTNYPLTITIFPGRELQIRISYHRRSFADGEVAHMLTHLKRLLGEMAANPHQHLSQLPQPAEQFDRRTAPQATNHMPQTQQPYIPPRNKTEFQLAQLWEEVLGVRTISVVANFFDLGGNSLMAYDMVGRIRQQFGLNVALSVLLETATIEQMAQSLHRHTDSRPWSPLVSIQPHGEKRPLFFVHPGPGSVFCYLDLARHLGAEQPFYALQARGFEENLEPLTQVETMAACYIESLSAIQANGPYLLGGHCFGGVVAFEMAQQIQKQGHEIALLLIMDVPPPPDDVTDITLDDAEELEALAWVIDQFYGTTLAASHDHTQQLDLDQQIEFLLDQLKTNNLLFSPDAGAAQIRRLIQISKANTQAYVRYKPPLTTNKITLIRAEDATPEYYGIKNLENYLDQTFGWGKYSTESVDVFTAPGEHVTMLAEPHVPVLAQRLSECLGSAQKET
ncbi:MAG: hypothetical protein IAE79_22090 [Anaerolinea sp.]|nr:hypothetical protein [Anaerolinea sp.]